MSFYILCTLCFIWGMLLLAVGQDDWTRGIGLVVVIAVFFVFSRARERDLKGE